MTNNNLVSEKNDSNEVLAPVGSLSYLLIESPSNLDGVGSTDTVFFGLFPSERAALDYRANEIINDIEYYQTIAENPWDTVDVYEAFKEQIPTPAILANPEHLEDPEFLPALKKFYLATHSSEDIVKWYYELFEEIEMGIIPLKVIPAPDALATGETQRQPSQPKNYLI